MSKPPDDHFRSELFVNSLPIVGDPAIITDLLYRQNVENGLLVSNSEFVTRLVEYAKRGNKTAFEALYWRYKKPIWNKLVRFVDNSSIAEDLHQETFMRAWINLQKLDSNTQFESWLSRIAANIAIDFLRRNKKSMFLSFEVIDEGYTLSLNEPFSVVGPEESVCNMDLLEQALARLTPQFRICLVLQDVWGYSQREVAQLLKISVSCVGSYVSRGREQLRFSLKQLEGGLK